MSAGRADLEQFAVVAGLLGDAELRFDYAHLDRAFQLLVDGAPLICMGDNRYFRSQGALHLDADSDRILLAIFIVAALLALAWMGWRVAREQRERDPLLRAWRALEKRYAGRGLGRAAHEPAATWARRLNGSSPEPSPLLALATRFSEWRYASHQRDPRRARELLRDLRAHRPFDGDR